MKNRGFANGFCSFLMLTTVVFHIHCTQQLAKKAGAGVTAGAIEGVKDQIPWNEIAKELAENPNIQKAVHNLAETLTKGVVEGASDGLSGKTGELTNALISETMNALRKHGGELLKDLEPELGRALRKILTQTILTAGSALHKSVQKDLAQATKILIKAALEGTIDTLAENAKGLDEKTAQFLKQKLAPGLGEVAHQFTKEAVLGVQEAVQQGKWGEHMPPLRAIMKEIGAGLGEGLGEGLGKSATKAPLQPILIIGFIAGGSLFIALIITIILLWRRYRQANNSLALFASQLAVPQNAETMKAIREAHQATNQTAWLDKFLKNRGFYRPLPPSQ